MAQNVEMPPAKSSPSVKYVLYTHYGHREADDFRAWSDGTPANELVGVRYLAGHLNGLHELLTSPAYEGILVMFYAPGFSDCLDGIAMGRARDELLAQNDRIRFAAD